MTNSNEYSTSWETLVRDVPDANTDAFGETLIVEPESWTKTLKSRLPRMSFGTNSGSDEFHPHGELGRGGMGVVHLASQVALGRLDALKTLLAPSEAER